VRKPDYGAKGAEVRIVKRERVRWKRVVTSAAGPSPALLVQEFIYTGLWPVSYRVNTLSVVSCTAYELRPTPTARFCAARTTSTSEDREIACRSFQMCATPRLSIVMTLRSFGLASTRLALFLTCRCWCRYIERSQRRAIVRNEVNALGHNWNFSKEFRDNFALDPARQFDGLRKAAYVLAEQTQRLANLAHNTIRKSLALIQAAMSISCRWFSNRTGSH